MAEMVHAGQPTQPAAEQSEQKQVALGYAPSVLAGFLFIDAHQDEKQDINQNEVNEQGISHCSPYP